MKAKSTKFRTAIASISVSTFNQTFQILLTLTVIFVVSSGCASCDVGVERTKPDIKVRYFDPENFEGNSQGPNLKEGEDALTEWEFGCQTNFDFDIIEESRMSTGKTFVRLKIKNVKLILSAPILVWLPKNPAPDIVAHEKGHQDICSRVYAESDPIAKKAAQSVVGRFFEAEGDTREDACKKALQAAQEAVCIIYHQDASDYASCISEIYDGLTQSEKGEASELVRKSFNNYKRVSNKEN